MTNRAVAAGVFRAWGILWSMNLLVGIPQLVNEIIRHGRGWNDKAMENYVLSSQSIAVGCEIIVVVFLFRKADWLASVVFPVEAETGLPFGFQDLRSIVFSAIGLYFVLDGARRAVGSVYQIVVSRPHRDALETTSYLWERDPENLIRCVAGIVGGSVLLIGPGRVTGFFKSLFGRSPEPAESEDPPRES